MVSVSPRPPDGHESQVQPPPSVSRGICPGPKLREYVKHSHAAVVTDVGTKIQRYGLMLRDET